MSSATRELAMAPQLLNDEQHNTQVNCDAATAQCLLGMDWIGLMA
jgi:hypothetical protein